MQKFLKIGLIFILSSYGVLLAGGFAIFSLVSLILGNVVDAYGLSKIKKTSYIHGIIAVETFLPVIFFSIMAGYFDLVWSQVFVLPGIHAGSIFFLDYFTKSKKS